MVLGAAAALLYGFLIWTSPPEADDGSSRHFRGAMFIYVLLPFFILAGPVWAAAWIAKRIDPSRRD